MRVNELSSEERYASAMAGFCSEMPFLIANDLEFGDRRKALETEVLPWEINGGREARPIPRMD